MQNSKDLAVNIISLLGLPNTTVFIEGLTKPIEDFFKQHELEQTKRNNEAYKPVFATLEQKVINIEEALEQKWYNNGYEDKEKEVSEQLKSAEDIIRSCFIFLGGLSNRINHFPNKNYALETSDYKDLQIQLGDLEKYMLEYMSHPLKPGAKLSEMRDVPQQTEVELSSRYIQSEAMQFGYDFSIKESNSLDQKLILAQKQLEESNQKVLSLTKEIEQIEWRTEKAFQDGCNQGQSDLKEILDVAEYLIPAIIVCPNDLLHIPNENLPEYLEKRNLFFKKMQAYRESYSKAKTPKEKEAYNKKSPRAYVQSSDFMAFLDLYAQEKHNVEDWCLLSVKVSPEALNQAYRKAVSKYNEYIDPNKQ